MFELITLGRGLVKCTRERAKAASRSRESEPNGFADPYVSISVAEATLLTGETPFNFRRLYAGRRIWAGGRPRIIIGLKPGGAR